MSDIDRIMVNWQGGRKNTLSVSELVASSFGRGTPEKFVMSVLREMHSQNELSLADGTYEMANVRPERTGLPFVVYISEKGNARHSARVKVGARADDLLASVSVVPEVELKAGDLSPKNLNLLTQWIEINRDVIMGYWDGTIQFTEDALAQLRPIPTENDDA